MQIDTLTGNMSCNNDGSSCAGGARWFLRESLLRGDKRTEEVSHAGIIATRFTYMRRNAEAAISLFISFILSQ